jgi:FkbM family methyltransferase
MALALRSLKGLVARSVGKIGYRLERVVDTGDATLDVFELATMWLAAELGRAPFFVQVGAFDGRMDDPMYALIKRHHWPGLLVEPQPRPFARLTTKTYADEPQLRFENAAIADRDGTATLHAPDQDVLREHYIASFDRAQVERRGWGRAPIVALEVPALTVRTLLARHRVERVDLLQIDAEGYDYEVIKQFDAAGVRPALIHFEHYHFSREERRDCLAFLAARGYRLHRDRMDIVALHADAALAGRPGHPDGAAGPA